MTPKTLITIVFAGLALTVGVQAATAGTTPDAMREDGFDRAVAAQVELWMTEDGFDRAVAAANERSLPVAPRYSDSVDGALVSSGHPTVPRLAPDTLERIAAASQRQQPIAPRYSDSVEGALAVGDLPNETIVPTTGSGTEIEWPQLGIGFGAGILLALGLFLTLRLVRIRPVAH